MTDSAGPDLVPPELMALMDEFYEVLCERGHGEFMEREDTEGLPEAVVSDLVQAMPDNPMVWLAKANQDASAGRDDEALAGYSRVIKQYPQLPSAYASRAELLLDLERPAEALEDYRAIHDLVDGAWRRFQETAEEAEDEEGDLDSETAALLDQTAEGLQQMRSEAAHNMAVAYLLLEQNVEAAAWAERALEIYPHNARAHMLAGQALLGLDRYAEAAEHFGDAAIMDPEEPAALLGVAMAKLALEEWDAAKDALEEALYLHPECEEAREGLRWLEENLEPDDA